MKEVRALVSKYAEQLTTAENNLRAAVNKLPRADKDCNCSDGIYDEYGSMHLVFEEHWVEVHTICLYCGGKRCY